MALLLQRSLLTICLACGLQMGQGQDAPCVNSAVTQADLANQLNLRSSGDFSVLINLPFSRLFCSPLVAKFLVIGVQAEHQRLILNEPQKFSGSGFADVANMTSWRLIDVSEDMRIALFDFLIGGEFHRLTEKIEYFVALRGCNTRMCSTVGVAKFTPWRIDGQARSNVGLAVGVAISLLLVVGVAIVFVWFHRTGRLAACLKKSETSDSVHTVDAREVTNALPASGLTEFEPVVANDSHTYLFAIGENFTYEEILEVPTDENNTPEIPSRGTAETSFNQAARDNGVPQAAASGSNPAYRPDPDSIVKANHPVSVADLALHEHQNRISLHELRENKNDRSSESWKQLNSQSNRIEVENANAQSSFTAASKMAHLRKEMNFCD